MTTAMNASTPPPAFTTSQTVMTTATCASTWLQKGRLLAYPTESVWGIGCDPFDQAAVQQLLYIKQRPIEKGMIVVTDEVRRIAPLLAALDDSQRKAAIGSWQTATDINTRQAHTWLLPVSDALPITIPDWITGQHSSVAVRVIAHPLVQQLCAQMVSAHNPYGFLVSTSCNPSGQPPAQSLTEAQAYFATPDYIDQVAFLAGETLGYTLPSQIHDALTGQILR